MQNDRTDIQVKFCFTCFGRQVKYKKSMACVEGSIYLKCARGKHGPRRGQNAWKEREDLMHQLLLERLKDERSKRVIFVSHCLLNENTRYLGGAFRRGCVDELVDSFQQEGLGIYQMRCPEQLAWGGVLKRYLLPFYGSKGTILYRLRHVLLPLFLLYTRWVYRRIAKEVVRDIEDYLLSGFEVVGIVGVGGSPSCGVWSNLNLRCSLEAVAGCPLAKCDRRLVNEEAVAACLRDGEGLFIAAIQRRLRRKRITIDWYEHDLLSEMRGESIHLWGMNDTQPDHHLSREGRIEPGKATTGLIQVQSRLKKGNLQGLYRHTR